MIRLRSFLRRQKERAAVLFAAIEEMAKREPDTCDGVSLIDESKITPPPCNLKLTPEEEAEGWELKYQGGMWVKTFDLRKVKEITIKLSKE